MLVLFETSAGFALFKVLDEKKLKKTDFATAFATAESGQKLLALKKFSRFADTTEALKATTALLDGTLDDSLKKFLKKNVVGQGLKETLAVADAKLGNLIKEKLKIDCVHDQSVMELMRGIRSHVSSLLGEVSEGDMNTMSLGLAHSLSRYKLKFSPDKVDTMIVQAIALLDDLDKELNTYSMRVREWYGWHFPELGKVIAENLLYAKVVRLMGERGNAQAQDFSALLPEDLAQEVKDAAQISMGTEVGEEDIANIQDLCEQVISITEYREQLFDYLKNRMNAIAPNLTIMVGELVGARLIAHAGSLLNLAKYPASTVQILGAEKALFRALKTKNQTPKYGLIYHASLIGQAAPKHKGKMARVLAAKSSLAIRCDALGEEEAISSAVGLSSRTKVERRLRTLEGGHMHSLSGNGVSNDFKRYEKPAAIPSYNASTDVTSMEVEKPNKKKEKKEKKKAKEVEVEVEEAPKEKKQKKAKKAKKEEVEEDEEEEEVPTKRKSKKAAKKEEKEMSTPKKRKADDGDAAEGKKKKKKKTKA